MSFQLDVKRKEEEILMYLGSILSTPPNIYNNTGYPKLCRSSSFYCEANGSLHKVLKVRDINPL